MVGTYKTKHKDVDFSMYGDSFAKHPYTQILCLLEKSVNNSAVLRKNALTTIFFKIEIQVPFKRLSYFTPK